MFDNHAEITPELVKSHGLKPEEYDRFVALVGRTPTLTELGIVSAMWNEHCSYKSSRLHLKGLPTKGKRVVYGPGENAGVVDIGDGMVCAFKMESHNHPSYIEPYQGATTGVGGILRDVFTMGARPVACLNALRFGAPDHPKTKHLVSGVVAGIGGYGNSFGVPTVAGSVGFHPRYNGNILVNAMAVGIAKREMIFTSQASGVGMPIVYLGSKTGRDGIHGATMASAEFDDKSEEKRPTVQVGDPFAEKLLLEASLEIMAKGCVIAIQDMGAAGLTCSAVEMGAKGDLGVELDLDQVPCREAGMSAYEMMLSESQERMLMVLHPHKEAEARAIFVKWGLDFAVIGKTTDTLRFVIRHKGEIMADLPIKELGDEAPMYDRPWVETPKRQALRRADVTPPMSNKEALLALLASPDLCSKRWVWEQYDHLIQGNTVQQPGGDAAIVRVGSGPVEPSGQVAPVGRRQGSTKPEKGLAVTCDVTPRYVEADPFEGAKQAVAECWRNLCAVGAEPIALTDNLNFGNPERPEIMGQFVMAVRGIGEAARKLDFPVVSGNVSLYNETSGQGILPTPTIGGVGLLDDVTKHATLAFKKAGDAILLLGETKGWLGASSYLATLCGREEGAPPPVDLDIEYRHGQIVRSLIAAGKVSAVHDLSDGGLGVALAEMAMAGGLGAMIQDFDPEVPKHALFFGEDQARYLVTCSGKDAAEIEHHLTEAGVYAKFIGVVGGNTLDLPGEDPILLNEMRHAHEGWLPAFMGAAAE
jgi:phosphoribosylformylglycinamidine synthase subunit PurL